MAKVGDKYEYAGFIYEVQYEDGELVLVPAPGQHPAAGKLKHRMAAMECYRQDHADK